MLRSLRFLALVSIATVGCGPAPIYSTGRHESDAGSKQEGGAGGDGAGGAGAGGDGAGTDGTLIYGSGTVADLLEEGSVFYVPFRAVPSDNNGTWEYDVAARTSDMLSDLDVSEMFLSPDGSRLLTRGRGDNTFRVLSTSDGAVLTGPDLFTDVYQLLGWIDDDAVFYYNRSGQVERRRYDGSDPVIVEARLVRQNPQVVVGRWPMSPDRQRMAVLRGKAGVDDLSIDILAVDGSGPISTIVGFPTKAGQWADCTAPTWLRDGGLVGVCRTDNLVYVAFEGDTEVKLVELDVDMTIMGVVPWAAEDEALVDFKSGDDHTRRVVDSSGNNLGGVLWLTDESKGFVSTASMRISRDGSALLHVLEEFGEPQRIRIVEPATGHGFVLADGTLAEWTHAL